MNRKKNNKGFTLIELLAVIVVLAIIALIATPIVMKTIEDSKKNAAIQSANNIIHSAELYFATALPRYGKIDVLSDQLNYNGKKPDLGEVEIDNKGKTRIYAYINGYCVTKEYQKEAYANKMEKENCSWYSTDNYETNEGSIFTLNNQSIKDYKIYGNSIQEVRSGKNLFKNLYSQFDCEGETGTLYQYFKLPEEEVYTLSAIAKYTVTANDNQYMGFSKNGKDETGGVLWLIEGGKTYEEGKKYSITTTNSFYISIYTGSNESNFNWLIENFDIQLEKGSDATSYEKYGQSPSPEYESNIESTGDLITKDNCSMYGVDACDNVGKYVIQVKSIGKNLLDIFSKIESQENLDFRPGSIRNLQLDKYYVGLTINNYYNRNYVSYRMENDSIFVFINKQAYIGYGIAFPVEVEGNTTYTISSEGDNNVIGIGYYDSEGKHLGDTVDRTFTTPENTKLITVILRPNYIGEVEYRNIQLEKGDKKTEYEAYQEKITNIYLDEPLRKIGDVADYIDFNNKKVVRNIKSQTLNNLESKQWHMTSVNWQRAGSTSVYIVNTLSNNGFDASKEHTMSNKFLGGNWEWSDKSNPYNYILGGNNNSFLYLIIENKYLNNINDGSSDLEKINAVKRYLSNNNVVIDYILETPCGSGKKYKQCCGK